MMKKILTALMVSAAVCAAAAALVMGAVGAYSASRMGAAEERLYRVDAESLGALSSVDAEYALVPSHVRDLVIEADAAKAGVFLASLNGARESAAAHLAVLGPLLRGDAEKERALREIEDGMAQHWAMLDEAGRLAAAGRRAEALAYVRGTAHPRFKATRDLMAGLRESINSDADGRVRANRAALSKASVRMAVCTIAVALLSVLSATCGLAVSRRG